MGAQPERLLSKLAWFFVRHWLAILIVLMVIFIVPIVGAPYLESTGNPLLQKIADALYTGYHVTCHQLPERSLFVFGYKMTVCARCFAIYLSFLAGCCIFACVRTKLKIWPIWLYVLLCVPMAIDGTAQLFGIAIPREIGPGGQLIWTVESTNALRIITGTIFGLASAFYVLPYLQEIFSEPPAASQKSADEHPSPEKSAAR